MDEDVFVIDEDQITEFSARKVAVATRWDKLLCQVLRAMNSNWPNPIEKKLEPFHKRESELAIENGCMFWGSKMVIPKELQSAVLCELHEGNPGMTKMKNLARTRVLLPNMDREIEETVRKCLHCQDQRSEAAQAPVHSWEFPAKPWNRLHIDFAGHNDFHWKVIIDARTKWPELLL
ncbi:hypothetical protein J437_LFUL003214 [Ladona fulva]|uniref:RNA-directed DNA polymerase n=1 Tax=Ladona fulva TaxID=123851 RepID=A0A8K0JXI4_LADFU|nr:hypothetical protein J437_LFUL003214 [Ladona fulva]